MFEDDHGRWDAAFYRLRILQEAGFTGRVVFYLHEGRVATKTLRHLKALTYPLETIARTQQEADA